MASASDEAAVRRRQREFDAAELNADAPKLRELLTDDFRSIGPKGFLLDKAEWIDRHRHFDYQSLDTDDLDVRLYGGAAIVRNVQRNKATWQGKPVELSVRVSQTWVHQSGQWRLAGIQFSPMEQEH